ncbi:MAG: hypothetical protein U5J82_02840 [Desulfobacterales bacterium]|nr:hypothetical protein [Desulfobacterales bacterium]
MKPAPPWTWMSRLATFDPDIGAAGLDQWNEQVGAGLGGLVAERSAVDLSGGVIEQRPRAFGQRLHSQQHAADVAGR